MKFKIGDAVVHPTRGAGVVDGIEERKWHGSDEPYYNIQLLYPPASRLMIPASAVGEVGLRRAASKTKLKKMWRVVRADPGELPSDHKERYAELEDRLYAGDVLQVAEAVRDMAWRQQREGRLTTTGRKMYEEGMTFLAGEIAAVQGVDLTDAEVEIQAVLRESLPSSEES